MKKKLSVILFAVFIVCMSFMLVSCKKNGKEFLAEDFVFTGDAVTYDGRLHIYDVSYNGVNIDVVYSTDGETFYDEESLILADAGVYNVFFKANAEGYKEYIGTHAMTIRKAELTDGAIEVSRLNAGYDGTAQAFEVTCREDGMNVSFSLDDGDDKNWTDIYALNLKNPGRYKVFYKVSGVNYKDYVSSVMFTINVKKWNDGFIWVENQSAVFDGTPHMFTVHIGEKAEGTVIEFRLEGETEWTSSEKFALTEAGEYRIEYRITAPGYEEYSGRWLYTISKAYFEDEDIVIDNKGTYIFDKAGQLPDITIPDGATIVFASAANADKWLTYDAMKEKCKNAGEYTLFYTVSKDNYYDQRGSFSFAINRAKMSDLGELIVGKTTFVYNGSLQLPHATFKFADGITPVNYKIYYRNPDSDSSPYNWCTIDYPRYLSVGLNVGKDLAVDIKAAPTDEDLRDNYEPFIVYNQLFDITPKPFVEGEDYVVSGLTKPYISHTFQMFDITLKGYAKQETSIKYSLTNDDSSEWVSEMYCLNMIDAGEYEVWFKLLNKNFVTLIQKITFTITPLKLDNYVYTTVKSCYPGETTDYYATYDGKPKIFGVEASMIGKIDVEYTLTPENEESWAKELTLIYVGNYTVYFRVKAKNYESYQSSRTLRIDCGSLPSGYQQQGIEQYILINGEQRSYNTYQCTFDNTPKKIVMTLDENPYLTDYEIQYSQDGEIWYTSYSETLTGEYPLYYMIIDKKGNYEAYSSVGQKDKITLYIAPARMDLDKFEIFGGFTTVSSGYYERVYDGECHTFKAVYTGETYGQSFVYSEEDTTYMFTGYYVNYKVSAAHFEDGYLSFRIVSVPLTVQVNDYDYVLNTNSRLATSFSIVKGKLFKDDYICPHNATIVNFDKSKAKYDEVYEYTISFIKSYYDNRYYDITILSGKCHIKGYAEIVSSDGTITQKDDIYGAVEQAKDGETIRLNCNANAKRQIVITKNLTINGNDYCYSAYPDIFEDMHQPMILVKSDKKITVNIKNMGIWANSCYSGGIQIGNDNVLNLDSVRINGTDNKLGGGAIHADDNSVVNCKDCNLSGHFMTGYSRHGVVDVWLGKNVTCTMTNTKTSKIYVSAGTATLTVDGSSEISWWVILDYDADGAATLYYTNGYISRILTIPDDDDEYVAEPATGKYVGGHYYSA